MVSDPSLSLSLSRKPHLERLLKDVGVVVAREEHEERQGRAPVVAPLLRARITKELHRNGRVEQDQRKDQRGDLHEFEDGLRDGVVQLAQLSVACNEQCWAQDTREAKAHACDETEECIRANGKAVVERVGIPALGEELLLAHVQDLEPGIEEVHASQQQLEHEKSNALEVCAIIGARVGGLKEDDGEMDEDAGEDEVLERWIVVDAKGPVIPAALQHTRCLAVFESAILGVIDEGCREFDSFLHLITLNTTLNIKTNLQGRVFGSQ